VKVPLAFGLLAWSAAASSGPRVDYDPGFAKLEGSSGRQIAICGYMIDSSNIVESPNREDHGHARGLSIADRGPLRLPHQGRVCVEGIVVYLGCESGPALCTDAAFDYGIRIQRVLPLGAIREGGGERRSTRHRAPE
jgi:hypothetical protein